MSVRRWMTSWAWSAGTWLAARRRARVRDEELRRHDYRTQTRGMGLRMTEWFRDRLRPRWLRLRVSSRSESEAG